jgi:hypothetical protein
MSKTILCCFVLFNICQIINRVFLLFFYRDPIQKNHFSSSSPLQMKQMIYLYECTWDLQYNGFVFLQDKTLNNNYNLEKQQQTMCHIDFPFVFFFVYIKEV